MHSNAVSILGKMKTNNYYLDWRHIKQGQFSLCFPIDVNYYKSEIDISEHNQN